MKKSRFTEAQIIGVLRQAEGGIPIPDLCREHGISTATFYGWRSKFGGMEQSIVDWHKSNPTSQRLASIRGIGPITASAFVATITDARLFSSGRHLAAWLGLVPRQNSSGGKERLGGITKKGDGYIRKATGDFPIDERKVSGLNPLPRRDAPGSSI